MHSSLLIFLIWPNTDIKDVLFSIIAGIPSSFRKCSKFSTSKNYMLVNRSWKYPLSNFRRFFLILSALSLEFFQKYFLLWITLTASYMRASIRTNSIWWVFSSLTNRFCRSKILFFLIVPLLFQILFVREALNWNGIKCLNRLNMRS